MGVIIRQSIKATIINYLGTFIGFLTTMFVLTRFLAPEEIGLTKVLLEVALLFSAFAQMGTGASAIRFFPFFQDKKNKDNGFFFYLIMLPTIGLLIFVSLYLILDEPVYHFFQKNSQLFVDYYYWVIPLIAFTLYWSVFEVYSNVMMRIVIPKFIREIALRLFLLVVYLLYAFQIIDLNGLVAGFVLVYGLVMVMTFLYVCKIGRVSMKPVLSFIKKPLLIQICKYTGFLIIGIMGGTMISKLDIFMVSSQIGLGAAGIYAIAFYIAAVIEIPSRSLMAISAPIASAALQQEDFEKANQLYKKVSLHQLIVGGFVFLILWINIDNIFDIIPNGDIYREGKWVVFFIGFSKLIEITLSFGGTLISFSKYYYWGFCFTFFITALTIATNLLLIPVFGITGAAMATFLTCLVSYVIQQWLVVIKVKASPYSKGTLKQFGLLVLLFAVNYILLPFENPWIDGVYRSIIVGGLGLILLYIFKISKEINGLINSIIQKIKMQ